MNRYADIEQRAAALYDDRLPYHNFNHALQVIGAGRVLMEKCREEDIEFDEDAVYYAMLLHDAGFQEDHEAMGFDSKEAYSAYLAVELLEEMNVPEATVRKVESAILCTHVEGCCRSIEDKIVRRADLAGMAADYDCFRKDTVNLKRELELLTGRSVTWEEWKQKASSRIKQFLEDDMNLVRDDVTAAGESVFREKVRNNIKALMDDQTPP